MSPGFRSLMWYVLYGTRGGPNRRRILDELLRSPANAHQLAGNLSLDYRTVRHHLRLLERTGAVSRPVGDAYATPYEIAASAAAYLETVVVATAPTPGPPPTPTTRRRPRAAGMKPAGGTR
ncbi:MAG: winged helix-turn-helix domain-containing protein [Thermoplasmata archaeon]|nr:winged helix-turn-helix domain-containing protein [Thermoplasmata archaeon]MCI4356295.1 winged helix-turn-helix domain-containing protein [Thermoplasmata archaeon]